MALSNYLATGTYSIVDSVTYSKQTGFLRFVLRVFPDANKIDELASKNYDLGGYVTYRGILGTLTAPPESPQSDFYVIGVGATGEWEGRDRLLAIYVNGEWQFWGNSPGEVFYDIVNENYCTLNLSTLEKTVVYPLNDVRLWNAWFTSALMFSETSNPFKQAYLFLKSRPGFESVTDL